MTDYPDTLVCLCCKAELSNLMAGTGIQPSLGLAFSSRGHYGSTVFDPMDGSSIQIVVCDPCLASIGWYASDVPRERRRQNRPFDTDVPPDVIAAFEQAIREDLGAEEKSG